MQSSNARAPVTTHGNAASRPVLLALDGSDLAERAVPVAAAMARRRNAPLVVCRAVADAARREMFGLVLEGGAGDRAVVEAYLHRIARAVRGAWPDVHVEVAAPSGPAAPALTDAVRAYGAQLAILTSHGRSAAARMLRGSVTEAFVRMSDGAVLVLWPWGLQGMASSDPGAGTPAPVPPVPGKRILVPLDGSVRTARVLPEAYRLAREAGGELVLLTVLDLHLYRRERAAAIEQAVHGALGQRAAIVRAAGVAARAVTTVLADPAASIIEVAQREACDSIAMTTHARGPVGRFVFGSIANHVAARAERPVLLTPPLADAMGHGLATMYPDVPVAVLELARPEPARAA